MKMGMWPPNALVMWHGSKIKQCSLLHEELGKLNQKHKNNKTAIPSIIDTMIDTSVIDKVSAVSDGKESSVSDCHVFDDKHNKKE